MISLETIAGILLLALFLLLLIGSTRVKISRQASLQGIEDPKAANEYDRMSRTPQFKLIRRAFTKKLKKYVIDGTIVDVGCGPGYLLQLIAKEYATIKLIGLDLSKEMTERAKANFKLLRLYGRVEFGECSVDHLPFGDETQDFAVSTFSLHHWASPGVSFNEIYRVLKPGGQMLLLDLRRDSRQIFLWLLRFAQSVFFRMIGLSALRRINEPIGSLLASYTVSEIKDVISKTAFSNWKIDPKLGWIYLYATKGI